MNSFYNTVGAEGPVLEQHETSAKKQERLILQLFDGQPLRRHDIQSKYKALFREDLRDTSASRAIRNLTKNGKLVKLSERVPGPYGINVHQWQKVG